MINKRKKNVYRNERGQATGNGGIYTSCGSRFVSCAPSTFTNWVPVMTSLWHHYVQCFFFLLK